ncbi:apnoia [Lycorma delicatula]|uniref:apnoia n=1 Tax=Lycorma delicatula TaxID=130591 RepID=UPI003F50DC7C
MALLPIMYKLGVITTLLVGLTVLTLKALTIGVILLILAFGGIFTKIKAVPWEEGYGHHKDVHIHVHPFVGKHHGYWKTWQRQEELDQIDPAELGQQQQQQQHHSQKPLYDHHLHTNSLAAPPRPYTYFPPSVSGLID